MTYFPCAECPIDCDFANIEVKHEMIEGCCAVLSNDEAACATCGELCPVRVTSCQSCPNSGGIDIDMSQLGGLGRDLVRLALTLQFKLRHDDLPANRENSAFLTKVGEELIKTGKFMWDLEEQWEGGKD